MPQVKLPSQQSTALSQPRMDWLQHFPVDLQQRRESSPQSNRRRSGRLVGEHYPRFRGAGGEELEGREGLGRPDRSDLGRREARRFAKLLRFPSPSFAVPEGRDRSVDLTLLAAAFTELLAPLVPFLLKAGEKAAEGAGEKIGADALERAKAVWRQVKAKPDATKAAREVAKAPGDDDAKAALRLQLRKLLAADLDLAGEVEALLAAAGRAGVQQATVRGGGAVAQGRSAAAGQGGAAIQGDLHGDLNITNVHVTRLLRRAGRGKPKPDLVQAMREYLEFLVRRHQYLEFRGMGVSDRVPLKLPLLEMFIPLKARVETPEGETWARQLRLAGRAPAVAEVEGMGKRLSEPLPVLDLLRKKEVAGLVLLGDPGAGKSTFLKYLALSLAAGRGKALRLGARLPVLVPLAAYANALAAGDLPLDRFIARYYRDRGVTLPLDALLEEGLGAGSVLLLLDGLDEVRERRRRHLVVERVRDCFEVHRKAGNQFVLTSRIVGYREVRPEAEGLAECTLVDFEDEEIESFVEKWTAALEKAATGETKLAALDAEREREELLAAVHGNPGVRSLAANPLLLTILALMKRQGVALPDRRVELYQIYVETLLKHWNLARSSLAGRPAREVDVKETLKVLAPLALWMHRTSPGVGLVKEGDLHRELEAILAERRYEDPERAADQFLEDVREDSALLLDRGGRQYGFIHLTFQEYLAATALAQLDQQGTGAVVEAIASHVGEASWHEVSLLAIGYLGVIQQRDEVAGAVVEELLRLAPGPAGEVAVLVGRAVADAGPSGVPPDCRKQVAGALLATMRAADRVEAPRRAAAGRVLAALGDPRPGVTSVDAMEFCHVPAGPFWMGSEEDDAYEDEKPRHRCDIPYAFRMARYPVTVAQFQEYVRESGNPLDDPARFRGQANAPVGRVSWDEALAFCVWLTGRWRVSGLLEPGWEVCLPSEAEWEKAAGGAAGKVFPWGEKFDANRANTVEGKLDNVSAVGCFPGGESSYGCEEMSGNVWEWTRSQWARDAEKPAFGYPYDASDGREALVAPGDSLRVLRGGSYILYSRDCRCACRHWIDPAGRVRLLGFRVAAAPFTSGL
jgi:formylglycine-generating enzyme required for sulfatase activity